MPSTIASAATCFDMALDLTAGRRGLAALAEAMRRWIAHLLGVEVDDRAADRTARCQVHLVCRARRRRHPDRRRVVERRGARRGDAPARVVGLFRLTFRDPDVVIDKVRGEPVYLILAMTPDKLLRMKPQNLVTGLPVRHLEAVT